MATPHVSGFAALLIQQGITSPGGDRRGHEDSTPPTRAPLAVTISTVWA